MNKQNTIFSLSYWLLPATLLVAMTIVFVIFTDLNSTDSSNEILSDTPAHSTEVISGAGLSAISSEQASQATFIDAESDIVQTVIESQNVIDSGATQTTMSQTADTPNEQQMENLRLLEHKVYGEIMVMKPLLSEIMTSEEFASLTDDQRMTIINLIVTRLNSGELRAEDVYPGRGS